MISEFDFSVGVTLDEYYATRVFSKGLLFNICDSDGNVSGEYRLLSRSEMERLIESDDPSSVYIVKGVIKDTDSSGRVIFNLICNFSRILDANTGRIYEV